MARSASEVLSVSLWEHSDFRAGPMGIPIIERVNGRLGDIFRWPDERNSALAVRTPGFQRLAADLTAANAFDAVSTA